MTPIGTGQGPFAIRGMRYPDRRCYGARAPETHRS